MNTAVPHGGDPTRGSVLDVRWGHATHAGKTRRENQDALWARPPVFLVADGMGGHRAGRDAADLVVQSFAELPWGQWATTAQVQSAVATAVGKVRDLGRRIEGAPGSTLTGVALTEHEGVPNWLVFNVGDSRAYLLRGENLGQVTVDHSHRQALVDLGLSPAEARARSSKNVIVRAIGGGLRVPAEPDQWLLPARTGDRLLLCSDGLTGELSDPLITAVLLAHTDPQEAAGELVAAALRSGARDNVTAVVVQALEVHGHPGAGDDGGSCPEEDTVNTLTTLEPFDDQPVENTRPDPKVAAR